MFKAVTVLLIAAVTFPVLGRQTLTNDFLKDVELAMDSNGEIYSSVDIECPAPSASGKLLVTHASYEYGKSKGIYIFKNDDKLQAPMTFIVPIKPDDDFDSMASDGLTFAFKMPNGQFFVSMLKAGNVKVGVNKNGTSGITETNCKVVKGK